jgi:hypothetical protein
MGAAERSGAALPAAARSVDAGELSSGCEGVLEERSSAEEGAQASARSPIESSVFNVTAPRDMAVRLAASVIAELHHRDRPVCARRSDSDPEPQLSSVARHVLKVDQPLADLAGADCPLLESARQDLGPR